MAIKTRDDFHYYVGRTMMHCQTIEHDIKLIYAGMLAGDMSDNLAMIKQKRLTLGKVVEKLHLLDRSDKNWFFSDSDFELLRKINGIRIHWAHHAYCEFVYSRNEKDFVHQARRLENDHNHLEKLSETIENVRLKVLKEYGRIR